MQNKRSAKSKTADLDFGALFSAWLTGAMQDAGKGPSDLQREINASRAYISTLANNKPGTGASKVSRPRLEIVDKLAVALNRPIDEARAAAGYIASTQPVEDEAELLAYFRELSPKNRRIALRLIRSLHEMQHDE